MAAVLLLRLEAPLVAFGDIMIDAHGPVTDLPSASMLTGLLANALGWRREDRAALQRLEDRLIHAARLDRSAGRFTEFQTAKLEKSDQGWTTRGRPEGRAGGDGSYVGPHLRFRDHNADVCVHVALRLEPADEPPLLADLAAALSQPARPLFLGRKPCLPADRIAVGIVGADTLLDALLITPLAARSSDRILVDLPRSEAPPEGFRRVHRSDRRDFLAGVHTGDSIRFEGSLPRHRFAEGADR
ncbi:type I-E CRISPR-associated protein Cas5/CasD [Pleomorphomonas sp. NRK KF1]|uniref:type I-E CRISPR-associated protein Cas5/CasD n=1 Tax=Pleomorphomonas sp. NRK KF1 TaxID=2943000 RepID=UPI0020445248|nr:type I-E CRISPR-associated protein Cas5/CasD [Pleomorphomonas sp. NRK KF1]MCM5552385.1 type I-E CRISPR-associated protein Cas5/CasD [Pleomorphomonas sp. NRK KF1]